MNILKPFFWLANKIDKLTYQGDFGFDFSHDAAQKITFILLILVIPWDFPDYAVALFIMGCVVGRIVVMSFLQLWINKLTELLGSNKRRKPFLWIPPRTWKLIVLGFLTYLLVRYLLFMQETGDFLALPGALIMCFAGFFVFAGNTTLGVAKGSNDPNKKGSPAWKKANGVEQVGFNLMNPLWRDKNGNYYEGTQYVPIPPPVNIVNKNK